MPFNPANYKIFIFITGAITLSLEVLASRIMTPYFGVSLYIWAGILSITLIFLALGYQFGGRISQHDDKARLEWLFLLAPIISAAAIAFACLLYPVVFRPLSEINLLMGSFVGGTLLLALPLVALSAMNPILIALTRGATSSGDAGAGRVFFISTVGSVAGVLVTAFVLIPNMTNYRALLWLGITLCLAVALLIIISVALSKRDKFHLLAGAAVVALLCGTMLVTQKHYFNYLERLATHKYGFTVKAEYTSLFGNLKVVEIQPYDQDSLPTLAYIQDGIIQSQTTLDGVSVLEFTYMLEKLSQALAPKANKVLVLGLAAGIIPQNLKRAGMDVSVVEINPDAFKAATRFFHLQAEGISFYWEDARTSVRRCQHEYDVAIIDLFQGDNTPDYLLTTEFFRDLDNCLRPNGVVIMNSFLDSLDETPHRRILATVAAVFKQVLNFQTPLVAGTPIKNTYIAATNGMFPSKININGDDLPAMLPDLLNSLQKTLSAGELVTSELLAGFEPVTDDHNIFTVLLANSRMRFRSYFVEAMSPKILVN